MGKRILKQIRYAFIMTMALFTLGCAPDKPTGSTTTAKVNPPPAQKASQGHTPKTTMATQAAAKPASTTRATENIKVNMPGQEKPASTPNRNAVGQLSAEEYKALSQEEKMRYREDRAFSEQNERIGQTASKAAPQKTTPQKPLQKDALPSACDMVSADFVSGALGIVAARDLYVKDGSGKNPGQSSSRSCFYKWEYKGNPDAGVLVQLQKNPVPEEFPEWASYYISSKKNQGDKMPDGVTTYRYKDFPGIGVQGAYNYELSRYVWRTESDHIIMIAFNIQSSEAEQLIWAEKIGKEVSKNFSQALKSK